VEALRPYDICVIAQKLPPGQKVQNESFRSATPSWRSPFPSDRATRERSSSNEGHASLA
jgi:hypothetical protein